MTDPAVPPEVADSRAFIPEDVPVEPETTADSAFPIIASNLFLNQVGQLCWLAVIRNDATTPLCSPLIEGSALRTDDTEAYPVAANAAGAVFDNGSGESVDCIAPGQTAVLSWTASNPHPEGVDEIARITYTVGGYLNPDATLDDSVVTAGLVVAPLSEGSTSHQVTGTVSATRSVRYLTVTAYPLNDGGAPLAELVDAPYSGTFPAGASADVGTTSYPGLFESYYFSLSYTF
jgi:hypothetical protein